MSEKQHDIYQEHIYSYMDLRKAVGWIGILLPFVLVGGCFLFYHVNGMEELWMRRSISHYYHSQMGNVFVGSLCGVALFLFFYVGYDKTDNRIADLAACCALGTAFFPTTDEGEVNLVGWLHLFFAASFFLILAYMSIFRFTKTKDSDKKTKEKKIRNVIYIFCGVIMLISLISIVIYMIFNDEDNGNQLVFWAEAIALLAFGTSWLVKGEFILKDGLKDRRV